MGDFSKDINSSFPNEKIKATLNILYTANWIRGHQVEFFKPYGISPQQFNILRILKGANQKLKVQTIKERMVEKSPNTTRLMDKLFAKNLIEREHCTNDRRVVYSNITEKGMLLVETISKNLKQDLLENLSETEANTLNSLLDKIR